jgi:mannitol-1-phosphate 5-dehydrogenase
MEESAAALSSEYGVPLENIMKHIMDLLYRFANTALKDTCRRVGRDPERKLSPKDRLIGAACLAMDQNVVPAYIAIGVAAGVRRYIDETASMQQNIVCAEDVLRNVSELEIGSRLSKLILDMYQMMLEGRGLGELRRAADGIKAACSENVV